MVSNSLESERPPKLTNQRVLVYLAEPVRNS